MNQTSKRQWLFTAAYSALVILGFYFLNRALTPPAPKAVSYSEFTAAVREGQIAEVSIGETELLGTLKDEAAKSHGAKTLLASRLPNIEETALLRELDARQVKYAGHYQPRSWWKDLLIGWLLPLLLIFLFYGVGMWRLSQGGAGPLTFGKNRARIYDQSSQAKVTFDDVAGVDESEAELVEVVDFLKNPQKYQALGGRIPKGVLLVGPPGTGKTLLAKAVAGEAGVPFFSISGSEFVEMFVGVGAARVRDLFEQAKQKAPCIIFIDELDAIGKSRSAGRGMIMSHDEREQTLNQLLVEMDGFDASKGVIIMAATNTPEVLDPALLRAGRFDRQIVIDRPDVQGREAILKVHARHVKLASDVDLKTIAARTPGMVGADLANVVNEAALLAARRGAATVEMRDLEEAIDRVMLGLEKKNRVMSDAEKERVAYHETGHALVALSVEHADPVHRVSIIPRSIGALGHTLQLPTQEKYLMTEPELRDQIAVMLGGRAAEEIIYNGVISTGASNDLERASELARQMVTRYGMSERLGQMTYGRPMTAQYLKTPFATEERNYSERTAELIDEETRRIMDEIYERVRRILTGRRAELERIAEELIRRETLDRAELEKLLSRPGSVEAVAV
ncbi:MAG TPA: ATP-dependent zinc metalloprotease FtsH [Blastocatellia bacterium]|nr:ATP-dependent zinc metalloprotease FtsH [Blastocatellia bacterium]